MIEQQFFQMVQKKGYFRHHRKVLLAISGGLDSMTLLDWFYKYREKLEIEIYLAHVNHGVREESDFEEEELKKIASKDCGTAWCKDFYIKFFWTILRTKSA